MNTIDHINLLYIRPLVKYMVHVHVHCRYNVQYLHTNALEKYSTCNCG